MIKNIIATSKCAAGTGEFIVQQFHRMGMTLEQGLNAYESGKRGPVSDSLLGTLQVRRYAQIE